MGWRDIIRRRGARGRGKKSAIKTVGIRETHAKRRVMIDLDDHGGKGGGVFERE